VTAARRIAGALLGIATVAACAIPTEDGAVGALPDAKSFRESGVSTFLERRCAGLDCHGADGRPLRLYSEWGLRLTASKDGSRVRGPTTPDEQLENYRAVVGLEPEALSTCFESAGDDCSLVQLLLKPLDTGNDGIRHKGGPVLRPTPSDPGWQCLFGWVSGTVNPEECARAARVE
jgi:hypothetical protein